MKDKLIKFGHKPSYYIYRKVGIISVLILSFAAVIAIPVTVKISSEAKAQEEQEKSSSKAPETSKSEELLHY